MAPVPPEYPLPILNIRVENLAHEGASIFFDSVHPTKVCFVLILASKALTEAVIASFKWLYTPENYPKNVMAILLVLRDMDGVAYTTDYLSLKHIVNSKSRARDEIMGVLVHEVVHCYQYDAKGTAPGGLIEGMADYVRLHEGLSPPHWKRDVPGETWDSGLRTNRFIQCYFLDWLETRYGTGTVREINLAMKDEEYHRRIFKETTGTACEETLGLVLQGAGREDWRGPCRKLCFRSESVDITLCDSILANNEA
ncbi:peptidase of plants and bacteria-domain-containing protein [Flagelloscypha sp. PMI_526]|nr:peptidase of plants and bacteria-domain-containing protein [Flagelloscypha sp. PMI_526]